MSFRIKEYREKADESYTGKIVCFVRKDGIWTPVNGRWVKCKMGKIMVNVLCHDSDKNPPKNYEAKPKY